MTLIDSSAWIESLRDLGMATVRARVESLLEAGEAAWCPIVRLELWRGVRAGSERKRLEFLDGRVDSLEINNAVWAVSTDLIVAARRHGLTAPVADVIIVATAHYHRVSLEHCDKHLEQLIQYVA